MSVLPLLRSLRPSHWWKNVPVAAALVFGDRLRVPEAVASVAACAVAFCLLSSAGYLVNDVIDRREDAAHPRRRERPVASGALSVRAALVAAGALAMAGLAVLALFSSIGALFIGHAYLATSLAYSLVLRRVPGVGPVVVALGFVLRLAAGAAAAAVRPSAWLLSLTGVVALALAVGKKEAEARRLAGTAPRRLTAITDGLLVLAVVGYLVYTQTPPTVGSAPHPRALGWTTIIVAAALARFRQRLRADDDGTGPAELIARDPVVLGLGALWIASVIAILRLASSQ